MQLCDDQQLQLDDRPRRTSAITFQDFVNVVSSYIFLFFRHNSSTARTEMALTLITLLTHRQSISRPVLFFNKFMSGVSPSPDPTRQHATGALLQCIACRQQNFITLSVSSYDSMAIIQIERKGRCRRHRRPNIFANRPMSVPISAVNELTKAWQIVAAGFGVEAAKNWPAACALVASCFSLSGRAPDGPVLIRRGG